jgi:hypothetical protein
VSRWTNRRPILHLAMRDGGWRLRCRATTLAESDLPPTNDLESLIAAVQAIEFAPAQRAGVLHVTVSDRWVHSFDVSPPRGVRGIAELRQLTEIRRTALFGGVDGDRKAVADWRAAETFVAAAMPTALMDALESLCDRHGWHLASVLPRWADAASHRWHRNDASWLVVADGTVTTLVHCRNGRARWVRTQVAACAATKDDARRLLARSALAVQGLPPADEFEWIDATAEADAASSDRRVGASAYDFAQSPSPWRRPAAATSALLGACALAVCAFIGHATAQWSSLRSEQQALMTAIDAAATANTPRKTTKAMGPAPDQVGAAKQLLARLEAPWMPWLRAFEASAQPDMALLSLEIDAATRRLHGSALARTPHAMLTYVDRLSEHSALGAPRLLRHDTADKVPGAPLRFEFGNDPAAPTGSR